jgi:exportin-1
LVAHQYLLKISQVEEREIFKICLEYWAKLVAELYEEIQQLPVMELPLLNLGAGGMMQSASGNVSLRKNFYSEILARLRVVMIERMVKPEEVRRELYSSLCQMLMRPVVVFFFLVLKRLIYDELK